MADVEEARRHIQAAMATKDIDEAVDHLQLAASEMNMLISELKGQYAYLEKRFDEYILSPDRQR